MMTARIPFDDQAYDTLAWSDCFVCRLVAGRPLVPNPRVIHEDQVTIAFLNQFPTQEGYSLVCPKRHVERFESELFPDEWSHLQEIVRRVAEATARATGAMRMYTAALGSPERNPHLHIHVCPCPPGTPFAHQQWAALEPRDGMYLQLSDDRLDDIARRIRTELGSSIRTGGDGN